MENTNLECTLLRIRKYRVCMPDERQHSRKRSCASEEFRALTQILFTIYTCTYPVAEKSPEVVDKSVGMDQAAGRVRD